MPRTNTTILRQTGMVGFRVQPVPAGLSCTPYVLRCMPRVLLAIVAAGLLLGIIGASPAATAAPTTAPKDEFVVGADISSLPTLEKAGRVFRVNGEANDAIVLFRSQGVNLFRVRVFVNPASGYPRTGGATQSLEDVRVLARRIKASGAKFLLDFHYSDTWADPGHQSKPAAWRDLDFDALEKKVHSYTAEALAVLKADGVMPDMVQVGNEIATGMLWPDGKLNGKTPEDKQRQWDRFARLVKAGVRAVRESQTGAGAVRVMIHIQSGGKAGLPTWFFENLAKQNVDFDVIGLSFYPNWDETMENLTDNMARLARAFDKDIMVAEVAYPWRGGVGKGKGSMAWPVSPEGQARFLAEFRAAVQAVPNHRGCGVMYWHPESIPTPGLRIWEDGAMALFDPQGNALPGLFAFGRGVVPTAARASAPATLPAGY